MAKAKKAAYKKPAGLAPRHDLEKCRAQDSAKVITMYPSETQLKRTWRYPVISIGASSQPFDPSYEWTVCIGNHIYDLKTFDAGSPDVTLVPDTDSSSNSELVVGIVTQNAALGPWKIMITGTKTGSEPKEYISKDPIYVIP